MKTMSELRQLHRAAVLDFEAAKKKGGNAADKAAERIEMDIIVPIEQSMAFLLLKKGQELVRGLEDLSMKLETALAALQKSIGSSLTIS